MSETIYFKFNLLSLNDNIATFFFLTLQTLQFINIILNIIYIILQTYMCVK